MGSGIRPNTRTYVIMRDGYACRFCGAVLLSPLLGFGHHITLDHLLPDSRGGARTADNLVVACMRCNCDKGDMTLDEFGGVLFPARFFDQSVEEAIMHAGTVLGLHVTEVSRVLQKARELPDGPWEAAEGPLRWRPFAGLTLEEA
jgi:hypothetical protein